MSKRRKILAFLIVLLAAFVLLVVFYDPFPHNPNKNGVPLANGSSDNSKVPKFVVPESPSGTLGLLAAFAAALGAFGLLKKREYPIK
jgi:hypothetical protein